MEFSRLDFRFFLTFLSALLITFSRKASSAFSIILHLLSWQMSFDLHPKPLLCVPVWEKNDFCQKAFFYFLFCLNFSSWSITNGKRNVRIIYKIYAHAFHFWYGNVFQFKVNLYLHICSHILFCYDEEISLELADKMMSFGLNCEW